MLNRAVLMGRLTADPELRHTPNGVSVTRFTIAVDRTYTKAGTEKQTDFIDIVAWRSTAEFASRYFHKGQLVAVEGSIQTGSYTDNQGIKRRTFEIVADNVFFAEAKRDYQQGADRSGTMIPPAPSFDNSDEGDFEEITGDDQLPF